MERRVAAGTFTQLAVRDREVFVVPKGESTILRISPENGAREEIVRNANHHVADLFATRTNLVWSANEHPMAGGHRRRLVALDLTKADAQPEKLTPVLSFGEGVQPDGVGGAVVSLLGAIGRVAPGEMRMQPVLEYYEAIPLVAYTNACVSDGRFVLWSTRSELRPVSLLCRVPLEGGRVEVLRVSVGNELLLLGATAAGILYQCGDTLWWRDESGDETRVDGAELSPYEPFVRMLAGHVFILPSVDRGECVHVLRPGSFAIERLPFEADRFEVTSYGIYRLTPSGVYETPW